MPSSARKKKLSAASTAAGPDGDRLADTTYIQRIATTGGSPARRGMHRGNGRHRGRGPLHRRLLLLEAHRYLTRRPCPPGPTPPASHNPQPQAGLPAPDRSPTTGPVTAMTARHRRWRARATHTLAWASQLRGHRRWHTAWLAGRFPPSGPIRDGAGDEFLL